MDLKTQLSDGLGEAIRFNELNNYELGQTLGKIMEKAVGDPVLTEGAKFDGDKVRLELISPYAEWGLGQVLTMGARKYAPRNWEKGISFSRVIGAIKRHLNAIEKGENIDLESGLFHADHLLTEAMFLSHFFHLYKNYSNFDDRPSISGNIEATTAKNCLNPK